MILNYQDGAAHPSRERSRLDPALIARLHNLGLSAAMKDSPHQRRGAPVVFRIGKVLSC